jgi:hypothetical protein
METYFDEKKSFTLKAHLAFLTVFCNAVAQLRPVLYVEFRLRRMQFKQ